MILWWRKDQTRRLKKLEAKKAGLDARISSLRDSGNTYGIDVFAKKSAKLAGQIAEIKALLGINLPDAKTVKTIKTKKK